MDEKTKLTYVKIGQKIRKLSMPCIISTVIYGLALFIDYVETKIFYYYGFTLIKLATATIVLFVSIITMRLKIKAYKNLSDSCEELYLNSNNYKIKMASKLFNLSRKYKISAGILFWITLLTCYIVAPIFFWDNYYYYPYYEIMDYCFDCNYYYYYDFSGLIKNLGTGLVIICAIISIIGSIHETNAILKISDAIDEEYLELPDEIKYELEEGFKYIKMGRISHVVGYILIIPSIVGLYYIVNGYRKIGKYLLDMRYFVEKDTTNKDNHKIIEIQNNLGNNNGKMENLGSCSYEHPRFCSNCGSKQYFN